VKHHWWRRSGDRCAQRNFPVRMSSMKEKWKWVQLVFVISPSVFKAFYVTKTAVFPLRIFNTEQTFVWVRMQLCNQSGPALAGAGPNAGLRRGVSLSSDFMTSSCSVNRVTIVVERRYKVLILTRELSTFANVRYSKIARSEESVLC